MRELNFIQYLKSSQSKAKGLRHGIGDDVAVLSWSNEKDLLYTTDMLVEDNHFSLKYYSYQQIGAKAIASNVSDIAAMGGTPTFAVVSVAKPKKTSFDSLKELHKGIMKACDKYSINLCGGDLTSSKHNNLVISVTLLGEIQKGQSVLLSKAKAGDKILVTGNLGRSGAGLAYLLNEKRLKSHFKPNEQKRLTLFQTEPFTRLKEGQILASLSYINAMTDVSDGIASDLRKIMLNSQVGAILDPEKLPVLPLVKKLLTNLEKPYYDTALFGGEDFELLFTAPEKYLNEIKNKVKQKAGTNVTEIGEIISEQVFYSRDSLRSLRKLNKLGYDQFGNNDYQH